MEKVYDLGSSLQWLVLLLITTFFVVAMKTLIILYAHSQICVLMSCMHYCMIIKSD